MIPDPRIGCTAELTVNMAFSEKTFDIQPDGQQGSGRDSLEDERIQDVERFQIS
jgi:hypothetical protein